MTNKIKKGDSVIAIAGKDKGKEGTVAKVFPKKNKISVDGLNMIKKHKKPQRNFQGGIIDIAAPFDISNVMFKCNKCQKATRLGIKVLENNKKVRQCKKCSEVVDN